MSEAYRTALAKLHAERERLIGERDREDRRIAQIDATIASLSAVVNDEPFEGGMADACRQILTQRGGRPMAPVQVRNELKRMGYDLSRHRNEMAAVHSVLKRLAETPQFVRDPGGKQYRWRPSSQAGASLLKRTGAKS